MIRYLYVLLDTSQSMNVFDLKPNRLSLTVHLLKVISLSIFNQLI